jgi:DGQHR domain-containing protein
MATISLQVLKVQQRDTTFYITRVAAKDFASLCSGLRASPYRETSLDEIGVHNPEDARQLVKALEDSAFAKEVMALQATSYDEDDPYQRILDNARVKEIARYLSEEDSILPNSVILAAREDVQVTLDANSALVIDWEPSSVTEPFNIIDGQHRVEGMKLIAEQRPTEYQDFEVAVTILVDLPFYVQAELFSVINGRQKPVSRSRIYDLLGYMPVKDPDTRRQAYLGEMAVQRFCHDAVKVLNSSAKSPWHQRIKMRGTGEGVITQAALIDHLSAYIVPKKERANMSYLPLLYSYFKDSDIVSLARLLVMYFLGISLAWPKQWETPEALSSSLFGKTNGVAVMFAVLHDLIVDSGDVGSLEIEAVKKRWSVVPAPLITDPPPGGSKGIQAEITAKVVRAMFGDDYDTKLRKRVEQFKPRLREIGGLLG